MSEKWSSKSAASAFKHKVFYFLIKTGGRFFAYLLLAPVVVFYTLNPFYRRKSYPYIERRFSGSGFLKKVYHAFRLNFTFGQILVDRAVLGITGEIKILSSLADQNLCRELYAKGKGLIIITAHAGAWQSAMSSFDFIEGEKYVLYHRDEKDVDKQAHEHGAAKQTVKFIDPAGYAGGAVEIAAALGKNAIICAMGDRHFGSEKNLAPARFLDGEIKVPASIYRIAASYGAPVIVVFFPFKGAGTVDSVIADYFFVPDRGASAQNYKEEAVRFTNALENFCKEYPYQYFNFYDIWR